MPSDPASIASGPGVGDASQDRRAPGRQNEYEEERPSGRRGEPPRPAQEPEGSEGSSNSGETAVDPATGTPNP